MTSSPGPSFSDVIELSENTRKSMFQLKRLEALRLDREKKALIQELKANSQTYLVFLEECAKKIKSGEHIDGSMIEPIKDHCRLIDSALSAS